jgi:hypothetical protein
MAMRAHRSLGRAGEESQGVGEKIPLELGMDLLVDGELSEDQRRAFLKMLDARGDDSRWRSLALRFLQRQLEKQTCKKLLTGGSLVPVDLIPQPQPLRLFRWLMSPRPMAVAAGLLIAAISSLVTVIASRPAGGTRPPHDSSVASVDHASFSPDIVGFDGQPISVPLVAAPQGKGPAAFFPSNSSDQRIARQSTIIQPDGKGNAIVIPFDTLKMVVY